MAKEEFAMLAHSYTEGAWIKEWVASRKLNGWGCIWDGGITRGLLGENVPWYFKGGDADDVRSTGLWTIGRSDKYGTKPKIINAPDWFIDCLPYAVPLHGELWKDDNLAIVKSVCGQGSSLGMSDERWHEIKYMVYNVKPFKFFLGSSRYPDMIKSPFFYNRVWSVRMGMAEDILMGQGSPFTEIGSVVSQSKIEDVAELERYYHHAMEQRYEGVMLLDPNSYYECNRSYNLLKYKPLFDAEAKIVEYEDGKTGKNIGKMGAVFCTLTWTESVTSVTGGTDVMIGKTVKFKVSGFTDEEREWDYANKHYPVGKQIAFTFSNVSNDGIPCSCNINREEG